MRWYLILGNGIGNVFRSPLRIDRSLIEKRIAFGWISLLLEVPRAVQNSIPQMYRKLIEEKEYTFDEFFYG